MPETGGQNLAGFHSPADNDQFPPEIASGKRTRMSSDAVPTRIS